MSARPADIHVAGLGIRIPDHVTIETEAVFRDCREVLYVDTGIATRTFLEGLCPRVTPLYDVSYAPGRSRLDAYHRMAARVLEAAIDHPPVAFAMHGHPVVYSHATRLIAAAAPLLGLRVAALPAVSSLDCLFAELILDPGPEGLLMYEATDMLLRRRPLLPEVPTLVWQVGNLETRLHAAGPGRPERLDRFLAYLLTAYAPDHLVTAFHAAPHPLVPSAAITFPLGEIRGHAASLHAGVTLYLPPARARPILDFDLLAKIDDPDHLGAITA